MLREPSTLTPIFTTDGLGRVVESIGWIAATDGSVRAPRLASDDGPYEPAALGAGVLLVRPGVFLDDPALVQPDMFIQDDGAIAPPPRHNDGSDRSPYVHVSRGNSDRADHSCGHSLCILGEPLSMRVDLGGIHFALEQAPVDEELTILTGSLSAIHLLCRWRRKRILTPYVRRAKCRDVVAATLDCLLARRRALGQSSPKSALTTHASSMWQLTA